MQKNNKKQSNSSNTKSNSGKTNSKKQTINIAIIGSGVAGMTALHYLNKSLKQKENIQFMLIDPNHNFVFTPRLTELITGVTKEQYLIKPKSIFKNNPKIKIIESKAKSINLNTQEITLNTRKKQVIRYDYLLMAQGASTNYCGIKGAQKFCFPYKEYKDAEKLKSAVLNHLQKESDQKFNIVIAGAGPTGVETSFAIQEAIRLENKLRKAQKKEIKHNTKVHIIDSGKYLLKKLPTFFQKNATKSATAKHIVFHKQERVKEVHNDSIELESGKIIPSNLTIWAAGVTPNVIETYPTTAESSGHIKVDRTMQVFPHKFQTVFAVGDCTMLELPKKDQPTRDPMSTKKQKPLYYPPTAQIASRQAECAAQNILELIKQKEMNLSKPIKLKQFNYKSKGWFVELSNKKALAQAGPINFKQPLAWHARDKYYKYFFWKLTKGY